MTPFIYNTFLSISMTRQKCYVNSKHGFSFFFLDLSDSNNKKRQESFRCLSIFVMEWIAIVPGFDR